MTQDDISADTSDDSNESLLEVARKRFQQASEAESENRKLQLDDLNFRAGLQWPEDVKAGRDQDKRPCLVINKLLQPINQLCNDQRQNRPSLKVSPVDDAADVDTAKILSGLLRHIEYNSNADVAYDRAFEGAATKGLGYFRVITGFCDPESFDQEIFIKSVRNSMAVYLDPHAQEPDGSDANWGFVFESMSAEEYRSQFKDSKLSKMDDWESLGDRAPTWISKDSARVAEYFYKTFEKVEICQLADKSIIEKSKLPKDFPPEHILATRETTRPAIKWCKINGVEVLESTDWPGQWIPIIPVKGAELDIDGKLILEGVVRQAKDSQRMYNYMASAEAEAIALAPKAPFIGVAGQFEGFEEQWRTANVKNYAYLEYNAKALNGQPAPAPQRQVFEAPVQAITRARGLAGDDIKAVTGIYDATLGNQGNDNSGIAIQRRNQQAQTSNFHFVDNLSRAMRHLGRICVDLIPHVYDTARAVRILGDDGSPEIVKINQVFEEQGQQKIYDLGVGKYDVTVSTGPSYQTKRQEAASTMLEFTKSVPNAAPLISDLIARNMDWPGSDQIADRLKKALPPGIAEQDPKDQKPQVPPEAQAQMQHMSQMIEQLTQAVHKSQDVIDQKTLELESKERIAFAQMQTDMTVASLKANSAEAQLAFNLEMKDIHKRLDLIHIDQPIQSSGAGAPSPQPSPAPGPQGAMASQDRPPTGGQQAPGSPMGV